MLWAMSTYLEDSGRVLLEREVNARAVHDSAEAVRTTCSFARAERLLGGEYHGRFLIELLQNAADAWRKDPRSAGSRSRVAVVVTDEPALIVANQGIALTPQVVIESLGHIGASTKSEGEAIGHKGIGFKSVLEMSSRPEVYSGLQDSLPGLAVRFDQNEALSRIRAASPRWSEFVAGAQGLDASDPLAPVPVLRYPTWVDSDDIPAEVGQLAGEGFDTVVRLPFDDDFARRRGISEEAWIDEVRRALAHDLSDQILLLLGTFSEVVVENRLDGAGRLNIQPHRSDEQIPVVDGAEGENVRVDRTGEPPTHWRIYRRAIAGEKELAGEIAFGLRYIPSDTAAEVVPAIDGVASAPFHLFFPTHIPSGLPFLLHGYFQVDASRKGFHGAAERSNERILAELAALVRDVVRQSSSDDGIDAASLVNCVAACPVPEDALATAFRQHALDLLDNEAWIPSQTDAPEGMRARPDSFLVDSPRLTRLIADVFSPTYVRQRAELELVHPSLRDEAIELVRLRQDRRRDSWDIIGRLCRPGEIDVWPADVADSQFRKFLTLVNWLSGEYPDETDRLLASLRGDEASRLVPVVSEDGGRRLLPLPDPSEGTAGKRSQLVMARVRSSGEGTLVPPRELEVSFLPEGLLESEQEIAQVRPLGIRQFTVDNVLDRLNGVGEATEHAEDMLAFLWKFLARERRNQYGTKKVAERASMFDPSDWFWCRPGRARESGARRLEQQRERFLSEVLLPTRGGSWRPAGTIAFGADWADWIETHSQGQPESAILARARVYRALEAVCPDPGMRLLAPPAEMLGSLQAIELRTLEATLEDDPDDDGGETEPQEELDDAGWDHERHAFLLRLGVWEVLPIEAFESRDRRDNRANFPWGEARAQEQRAFGVDKNDWVFGLDGWRGRHHWNVYLAEDYQFQWPLAAVANRDANSAVALIDAGAGLFGSRLSATFFCPSCSDSGTRHDAPRQSGNADGYPSSLAIELRTDPWIPVQTVGQLTAEPATPSTAWWLEKIPSSQGLMTSPWRFVPICGPSSGITDEIRRLAHITTIEDAGAAELGGLLHELRRRFAAGEIDLTRSTDRRSFVSLHSMVYERLAELQDDAGRAVIAQTEVLCTRGSTLTFETPENARHDDGTYSSYVRHFVDRVSLAVIPRDQVRTARDIGIRKLVVNLRRMGQGDQDGMDVTDELRGMLVDRAPELLAILVHHSLGSQTLTLDSDAFRQRAQRLKRLTVRKVEDLVIFASVEGLEEEEPLGDGQSGDLFLEAGSSGHPVLFHDFDGSSWTDRLRRKIAPHLAVVLEASPYAHTFALFLQAEGDAEREEFLLELGISDDDINPVAAQLGAVGEAESAEQRRWYMALMRLLGANAPPERLDHDSLDLAFRRAGLTGELANLLVLNGGSEDVRANTQPGSSLRALNDAGYDLGALDDDLRALDSTDGLHIRDAKRTFKEWMRNHERRVVAVRARTVPAEQSKEEVKSLAAPATMRFTIDPARADLLAAVAELVGRGGLGVAQQLADDPIRTLTGLGGFGSPEELDVAALRLYDVDEQQRALSSRASRWRHQIRRIAVLVRMASTETRTGVRGHDAAVAEVVAMDPTRPSDLVDSVELLFPSHPRLRQRLLDKLDDSIFGPEPDEAEISQWLRDAGVDLARLAKYEASLSEPRNKKAAQLRARANSLSTARVTAVVPAGLVAPKVSTARARATSESHTPIAVAKIKVSASFDQRKRELGDEGEQWALADAVGTFLSMADDARALAIDDVRALLTHFAPEATKGLLEHATAAAAPKVEDGDDDLVDALYHLLHVSRQSDGFGFDIIGWASPEPGAHPHAICMEVKSTSGGGFHLSSNEWAKAEELRARGQADRYAVLAVQRGKAGGVPISMDLLVDPVGLHEAKLLVLTTDGYVAQYRKS